MYKFRLTRGPNSFKLGMLAGISAFLALESAVGIIISSDLQIVRLLLTIVFSTVSILCAYFGCYRK